MNKSDREPTGNTSSWKFKRGVTYFFFLLYFPIWLGIEISGMFLGRSGDLSQIAFDISYVAHIIQLLIKMCYYLYFIEDIRSLCLKFEVFHTTKHRPICSRVILGKRATFLRKLARTYYTVTYMNFLFWTIGPLVIQPLMYMLTQTGIIDLGMETIIPKFFPVRYPFDETTITNRLIIAFMEVVVLSAGFIYFIPIDQFLVSVIIMICAEIDVICKSIQSIQELKSNYFEDSYTFGADDDKKRIDINLFIQDHQRALESVSSIIRVISTNWRPRGRTMRVTKTIVITRTTKKISEVINPILGLIVGNCMVLLCTLAIVITTKLKSTESMIMFAREITGFSIVMITSLITLYLYSWMCGELKASEEDIFNAIYSANWYDQPKSYRSKVLIVMAKSLHARPLRMMSTGDMDRETFIQGLKSIYTYYNFLTTFE